ncbi:YwqH-like family protein [Gracilibacillus kekensis]|uniref:Uncharacterized protein n=1 Tax=Gracilibacillus kekensis TaxID=1027249 RepID=A0A1M7JPW0_9BACI|nr:DUF5082 family protein [Gracilibacillus kekensis]SHM54945.1 protein of unknown function [Gracilibacillus kekensis]
MSSLSQLRAQKRTVLQGMNNSREQISILEDKITRLQRASNTLSSNLSELNSVKSSIESLTIENSKWKGRGKEKFDDFYITYKGSVKGYLNKVKDAKETIDEDISRYSTTQDNYVNGLNNLQNTLSSLNYQISVAEREGE